MFAHYINIIATRAPAPNLLALARVARNCVPLKTKTRVEKDRPSQKRSFLSVPTPRVAPIRTPASCSAATIRARRVELILPLPPRQMRLLARLFAARSRDAAERIA